MACCEEKTMGDSKGGEARLSPLWSLARLHASSHGFDFFAQKYDYSFSWKSPKGNGTKVLLSVNVPAGSGLHLLFGVNIYTF
jgi:hypothetical protein